MNVRVIKSDPPETTTILAEAIVAISKAMIALTESGLNRHAIVTLIVYETRLSRKNVNTVIDAQRRLAGWYCRNENVE